MELYFLRHGAAVDQAPAGGSDADRPLSDEGAAEMEAEARGLERLNVRPDLLLTSPLVRAQQTATIVGRVLGVQAQPAEALAPGCDLARLLGLLGEHSAAERVMVVGHEPDFSRLIGTLTGGSRVQLKKGGLARVDLAALEQGAGVLVWLLPPRVLREVAGS